MKILIAPDKFKGSLSAEDVGSAIQKGIKKFDKKIETILHPLADGGEGTLGVLENLMKLKTIHLQVHDPLFRSAFSFYKKNKKTVFIEMATASGLGILEKQKQNPMHTTTFGTGELILDAIQKGAKKIFLFIGGSATNDVGIGMAAALGFVFFDKKNNRLKPIGKNLIRIHRIDSSQVKFDFSKTEINVVCDVENKLLGKNGAAQMYAAQKGASKTEVKLLEKGSFHFAKILEKKYNNDFTKIKGGGAAGGLGVGAVAFLNAKIVSGIRTILEISGFKNKLKGVDLVITGEGKLDKQTLEGKVIKGVSDFSKAKEIPVHVICGSSELIAAQLQKLGVQKVEPILKDGITLEQAIFEAKERVEKAAFLMMKDIFKK